MLVAAAPRKKILITAVLALALLGASTPAPSADFQKLMVFVVSNAVADTVPPIAARAGWGIKDLQNCRALVVDEINSGVFRTPAETIHRVIDDASAGTMRLPTLDFQLLAAANDLVGHIESNALTKSCISALASEGIAGTECHSSVVSFREFSVKTLLHLSSVTVAIENVIRRRCDVFMRNVRNQK